MAFSSIDPVTFSAPAAAAIARYTAVKLTTAGLATPCTAITDIPVGIALEDISADEATAGKAVPIQFAGIAKFKNNGVAKNAGVKVATSTGALAQAAVTTQHPIGVTVATAGATAELVPVLLQISLTALA